MMDLKEGLARPICDSYCTSISEKSRKECRDEDMCDDCENIINKQIDTLTEQGVGVLVDREFGDDVAILSGFQKFILLKEVQGGCNT